MDPSIDERTTPAAAPAAGPALLRLDHIDKSFGVTRALSGASLEIRAGEVVGLVGPNGAGKSTLMKVLTGVHEPSGGTIHVRGRAVDRMSEREGAEIGIACAYQDLSVCTNLAVYENFAMLTMSHRPWAPRGWRSAQKSAARELLGRYFPGNGIDVTRPVAALTLAERQMVEICKALMTPNLGLLVLDEPTSALSANRVEQLHHAVSEVSGSGVAVVYISHKLDEISKISHRIVLLKNGTDAGEFDPTTTTPDELIGLMGGEVRERAVRAGQAASEIGPVLVSAESYSAPGLHDIDLSVRGGEIVGVSGLVGGGQTALLRGIFRSRRRSPRGLRVNGRVAYVSGDRAHEGVFPLWSILDNILISNLHDVTRFGLISAGRSREVAGGWFERLRFRAESVDAPITALSGGNQQKALIARGLASGADVILVDELVGDDVTVQNVVRASFTEVAHEERSARRQSLLSRVLGSRLLLPLSAMIVIYGLNALVNPNVLSAGSTTLLLGTAVPLVLASLGQMFIVAAGDIDMGNGYSIGLANVLVAVVLTRSLVIGLVSLLVLIAAYALMGALIHVRRLPAIVVTLGAQFIWLGVALIVSPLPGGTAPAWLTSLSMLSLGPVPMAAVICVVAALATWYLLFRWRYGIILRAIGNNLDAVERSGWSYLLGKMTAYALSGLMVALAGVAFTAVTYSSDANSAVAFCMMSIATVIVGGCEMAGGFVEPLGVVAAGIAMSLITSLLIFVHVDSNLQMAVTGLIIIVVLASRLLTRRKGVTA